MAYPQNKKYTVGWITALPEELVAARLMLDEDHGRPQEQHPSDNNIYHLGKIGPHNIVIACLPSGSTGTVSAATVASQMLFSFESVKVGLLVGIGGGIPSEQHDIRLGDIVVSKPGNSTGGVIQYDFERIEKEGGLKRIGSLNKPPALLLKAVASLQADHVINDNKISQNLSEAVVKIKNKNTRDGYSYQDISKDKLYEANYHHESGPANCNSCKAEKLIERSPKRSTTDPYIHYGIIASSNHVIRDSRVRDYLGNELGAICIEMEAAGLINDFPCLIIRGISDYADSHKNDIWQRYAAAAAAAYAKELLEIIPSRHIDEEKAVSEQMKALEEKVAHVIDSNQKIYSMNEKVAQKWDLSKLRPIEGAAFDSYLNSAEDSRCHPDTRVELIQKVKAWFQDPESQTIFWLNGMAGTGKSTISRTIAEGFANENQLGASFFFKRGEGDRSHAGKLFTTLASQLAVIQPALIPYVTEAIDQDSSIPEKDLETQFERLIFQPLSKIVLTSRTKLAIVIDALDECETERDIDVTIHLLSKIHCIDGIGLKVFLTSRPELPIRLGFKELSEGIYQDLILHEIPRPIIEHDISAFLKYELARIHRVYNQRLPENCRLLESWPGEPTIQTLTDIASPLFIFAATICRFIGDPRWDPEKQLARVMEYQTTSQASKLDRTYLPILDQLLHDMNDAEKECILEEFRTIVGSIIILADPLSIISLASLLETSPKTVVQRLDSLHSALSIPDNHNTPVRLLHLSFRDFLLDNEKRGKSPFWIDEKEAHKNLLVKCLKRLSTPGCLRENICNLPSPGSKRLDIDSGVIQKSIPADVQYACQYWVYHLEKCQSQIFDHAYDPVYNFLEKHFLHWLEVLSLLGKTSQSIHYIATLETLVGPKCNKARQFIHDAKRFVMKNRSCIEYAPLQIYSSGLIFAPETCVIKNTFKAQIPCWIHGLPAVEKVWGGVLQTLEGHSTPIRTVSFSPDSRLIVSGDDGTVMLWDVSTGTLLQTFEIDQDDSLNHVEAIAISPNGKQVLTGCLSGTAILWDSNTGEVLHTLLGHRDSVSSVIFSPDGKLLFTAGSRHINIWDSGNGSLQRTLTGDWAFAQRIVFSPDATLFASIPNITAVRIWDSATGIPLRTFSMGSFRIESDSRVALSHDGRILAFTERNGIIPRSSICLWDLDTGISITEPRGHWNIILDMTFSSTGSLIAVAKKDGSNSFGIWDINTGEQLQKFEEMLDTDRNAIMRISPDGKKIASVLRNHSIGIYDTSLSTNSTLSTQPPLYVSSQGPEKVGEISFSPDSNLIASISLSGTIRVWNLNKNIRKEYEIKQDDNEINSIVVFSPDSKLIATALFNRIQLWNLETGTIWKEFYGQWGSIYHILFLPNGKLLNFAKDKRPTMLWKVEKGELDQEISTKDNVECLAISPDNKRVALSIGGTVNSIGVWDLTAKSYCWMFDQGKNRTKYIGFSPDNKTVVFTDGVQVFIRDPAFGFELQSFSASNSNARAGPHALSPNGNFLTSIYHYAGADAITILDIGIKQMPVDFSHQKSILSIENISFSRNGKIAASVSETDTGSGSIQIWNPTTGALLRSFDDIQYDFSALKFVLSADGRQVAIRKSKETVDIWRLYDEVPMLNLKGRLQKGDFRRNFSPDGTLIALKSPLLRGFGIKLWNLATGVAAVTIPADKYTSYIFSPDGIFLVCHTDKALFAELWDPNTGILQKRIATLSGLPVFSSDGRFMISSVTKDEISILEFPFDIIWKKISLESVPYVISTRVIAISADGQLLAFATRGKFLLFDTTTESILVEFLDDEPPDTRFAIVIPDGPRPSDNLSLSFSETGPYLLTGSGSINISKFYDSQPVPTSQPRHGFRLQENWITRDEQPILWLPPEHRPDFLAFHDNTFMMGTETGLVYFLRF